MEMEIDFFEKGNILSIAILCSDIVTISLPRRSHKMLLTKIDKPINRRQSIIIDKVTFPDSNRGRVPIINNKNKLAIIHLMANSERTILGFMMKLIVQIYFVRLLFSWGKLELDFSPR